MICFLAGKRLMVNKSMERGNETMKKVLFVSHIANFAKFNKPFMKWFKAHGYEVHYASTGEETIDCDKEYKVSFSRSPFRLCNIKAYKDLKKIMLEEKYDLVHCHTPMGGVIARLAAKATNTEPVIYTAHGFHFYKGASVINTIIYKNVEKWLAHYTDALVTINSEDYHSAKKFKLKSDGKVYQIPGIGVDFKAIEDVKVDKEIKTKEMAIPLDSYIVLMVAEFTKNKNHKTALKAFKKANISNSVLLLCGSGAYEGTIKELVKEMQLENKVFFLGYRKDISEIVNIADVFLFPSFREGLSVSVMEAMAAGLPVICSNVRGNLDLIDEHGGFLCNPMDHDKFSTYLTYLANDKELSRKMGAYNREKAKNYTIDAAVENMAEIYRICLKGDL